MWLAIAATSDMHKPDGSHWFWNKHAIADIENSDQNIELPIHECYMIRNTRTKKLDLLSPR